MAIGTKQIHRGTEGTESVTQADRPRSNQKRSAHLVTADDALWPQFGAVISNAVVLTQIDGIEQFLTAVEPGHAGIVIWDARGDAEYAAQLARLQRHSARLAVIVLDLPATGSQWKRLADQNQIVCLVALPFTAESLNEAIGRAHEEVQTRTALLGTHDSPSAAPASPSSKGSRTPLIFGAGVVAAALAAALATYEFRHHSAAVEGSEPVPASTAAAPLAAPPLAAAAHRQNSDDSVDGLLEKATQAMLERRYIEPVENSALGYYRSVLGVDANNAEAKQGLDRLEGLLMSRAQTALDQQHFESALQALEIARSINRDDPRMQILDSRLSKMRSELGSTAIQAAINAGNYDRATALIDEAAQAKTLSGAQLAPLRNDVARRRDDADVDRLIKTAEARIQQDRLIDPPNDSAAHWFAQAKKNGNAPPALAAALHDFGLRLVQAARTAIEQGRLVDADRLLNEARLHDVPSTTIAELTHDAAAARNQQVREKNEGQRFVDLVKTRMAQGNLLEPDQDSAFYYLNSLKTADPQSPSLPELSHAVQGQIVARAGSLFDQGHAAEAQAALQNALKLGSSAEASALADRISRAPPPPVAPAAQLKLLKPVAAKYPAEARARNKEGWVELAFTVLPNGHTAAIRVVDSSPPNVFDLAAMDAIRSARYEPIPKDAPQTARSARIHLLFKLDN